MHQATEITVSNLDHLGLIAGLVDEIGIVQKINELIGEQPGEIVSPGQAVKAMIINGLGHVWAPLYLFPKFFEGKAIEHLIGEGIQASHLNEYKKTLQVIVDSENDYVGALKGNQSGLR